jgi:hypothetical protein
MAEQISRRGFIAALIGIAAAGRAAVKVVADAAVCPMLPVPAGVLTMQMIEDAYIMMIRNCGRPDVILVSPQVFAALQKY